MNKNTETVISISNKPENKTSFNLKASFNKFKVYILAGLVSIIGAISFVFAPVSIGLISLTPIVPVLTGSALSILAFRQYASQSEIKMGNNANTSIGTGYTHILMCSIVFTTLGFMGPLLGPAAAFVIPSWYVCIAVCALSALSAGGYEKLSDDWKKSPLSILRGLLAVMDFVSSLIPFRTQLKNAFGNLHQYLGTIFSTVEMALFVAFSFLGGPLLPIGIAGLTTTALNFARAKNYFPVKFGTFLEKTFSWLGVCAGLFIDNPVLRVYTVYTLVSLVLLKIGSFIGTKFLGIEFNSKVESENITQLQDENVNDIRKKVTWEKLSENDTEQVLNQIPNFEPLEKLICRNDATKIVQRISEKELIANYEKKYNSAKYLLQEQKKTSFANLKFSPNIFHRLQYYSMFIPKNLYWMITSIQKPALGQYEYITQENTAYDNQIRDLQHASSETDIKNLIYEFFETINSDYITQLNRYTKFQNLKEGNVLQKIEYYALYIPKNISWYASRIKDSVQTSKNFIKNKVEQNNFAINLSHIEYDFPGIPLNVNIEDFDTEDAHNKIMSIISEEYFAEPILSCQALKNIEKFQDDIRQYKLIEDLIADPDFMNVIFKILQSNNKIFRINNAKKLIPEYLAAKENIKIDEKSIQKIVTLSSSCIYNDNEELKNEFTNKLNESRRLALKYIYEEALTFIKESISKINKISKNSSDKINSSYISANNESKNLNLRIYKYFDFLKNESINIDDINNLKTETEAIDNLINKKASSTETMRKYEDFKKKLSILLFKIKTGRDLAMDKTVHSVKVMQKISIKVINFILDLIKDNDSENIVLAQSLISNIIEDTDGRCAQAPFTIFLKLYNQYVKGLDIEDLVNRKIYTSKELLSLNLQHLRNINVNQIIYILNKDPLIRSLFFHMDFMDHHDNVYVKAALSSLNLNYYKELDEDISTTNIDIVKEIAASIFAYIVKNILIISNSLYNPDGIIDSMTTQLIKNVIEINQKLSLDPDVIPKQYNVLSCLKLWIEEKNNVELNNLLADITDDVNKNSKDASAINQINIKKIITSMLLDLNIINFTEKGIKEVESKKIEIPINKIGSASPKSMLTAHGMHMEIHTNVDEIVIRQVVPIDELNETAQSPLRKHSVSI